MSRAFLLALAVLATGCLGFDPPEGRLACTTAADCPDGWSCGADARCHASGGGTDAGVPDAGPGDAGPEDAAVACPGDPCDVVQRCGCTPGRGCYPNNALDGTTCLPVGTSTEGSACSGELNACEPGLICGTYPGGGQLCARICDVDADCSGGAGSRCARDLGGSGSMILHACTIACDIVGQTCPTGFRCEPGSIPPEPSRMVTDCVPTEATATGAVGDSCSVFQQCQPGLTCASGMCLAYCAFGSPCPSGRPCSELTPGIQIGGVEYGVCPP
ncbi:MAG: hypothetical protein R3B82_23755 [Sandaracinaceae bacterium]